MRSYILTATVYLNGTNPHIKNNIPSKKHNLTSRFVVGPSSQEFCLVFTQVIETNTEDVPAFEEFAVGPVLNLKPNAKVWNALSS